MSPPELDGSYVKYDGGVKSIKKNIYLITSYLFCMNVFLSFEILTNTTTQKTLVIFYILFSLINIGLLFENGPWAKKIELTRIAICSTVGLIYSFFVLESNMIAVIIILTGTIFYTLFFRLWEAR